MGSLRVDRYDNIVTAAHAAATAAGVYIVARIQDREAQSAVVTNGQVEAVASGRTLGMGVQAFAPSGHAGLASTDRIDPESARGIVVAAAQLAKYAASAGTEPNRYIFNVASTGRHRVIADVRPIGATPVKEALEALVSLNRVVEADGLSVRSTCSVVDEEWRVIRSDGTDVSFNTPRAFVQQGITARRNASTASVGTSVSGSDARVLVDESFRDRLERRTRRATALAVQLCGAPRIHSGHYRLVIDYALAKGLAHEAFGHAAETDGMESSILGRDGKMIVGETVAAPHVSIIDGPVEGDYAYQPVSASGVPRETVRIVDHGVLQAGLGDIFSAAKAGVRVTGADRVESFRSVPVPRMTNIRVLVDDPTPLDAAFEDVTPEMVRDAVSSLGLLSDGVRTLYLTGYKGGQVNPKDGDFVFNCAGIYELTEDVRLYLPAIFSGKVLSALRSILTGIGPVYLDAMGHCGKAGQSVPSSGGSHAFLVLDANPDVTIGGTP